MICSSHNSWRNFFYLNFFKKLSKNALKMSSKTPCWSLRELFSSHKHIFSYLFPSSFFSSLFIALSCPLDIQSKMQNIKTNQADPEETRKFIRNSYLISKYKSRHHLCPMKKEKNANFYFVFLLWLNQRFDERNFLLSFNIHKFLSALSMVFSLWRGLKTESKH